MVPIEISSPHSYSTSIHTFGLSCTVWPQYTTRQTERESDGKEPSMLEHRRPNKSFAPSATVSLAINSTTHPCTPLNMTLHLGMGSFTNYVKRLGGEKVVKM